MQKPRSLWQFERVLALATVLEIANTLAFASRAREIISESVEIPPETWSYYLVLMFVSPAFAALVWFFVVKRASNAARIVYSLLVALGAVGIRDRLGIGTGVTPLHVQAVLIMSQSVQIYGIWLLWRPDCRDWFAKGVGNQRVAERHSRKYLD